MKLFVAIVALAIVAASAQARDLTAAVRTMIFLPTQSVHFAQTVTAVPLKGVDHRGFYQCPYLQVYVNGHGPFTFLFDTGSSYTTVSTKVANAARAPVMFDRGGKRDVVRLDNVTVSGVTLKNIWAIHDDDFGVDGVLGFRAFGDSNLLLDLAARRLDISAAPMPLPNSFKLPYETPFNVPTIPLILGSHVVKLLIDTGDDAYGLEMRRDELGSVAFQHAPLAAQSVLNGAAVQPTLVTTLAEPIRLGPLHADAAAVGINDSLPVGDFGVSVLRQFRIEFLPAQHVVAFQPLFAGDTFAVAGNRGPGFTLAFDGSGRVTGVVPGSQAEQAGMAACSTILSIDRRPVAQFDPRIWDARIDAGAPMTVRWRGSDKDHETVLKIEEIH
jgi:hypothetical protein